MRLHRFYVSQPLGEEVVIENVSILKQWLKVFRYTKNDSVILFNGDGFDVTYTIEEITLQKGILVQNSKLASYIPTKKIKLYLSLIKKDNFEFVVQKATELEVSEIIPVLSERSEKKNLNKERLIKIATEASEQCGRGDVPTISDILTLKKALETMHKNEDTFVLQMNGINISETRTKNTSNTISLFIGPEGGWSVVEEELFKNMNIVSISLGNTVLRAETASIAALALFK
ncbi:MAG: 16S rRNA (uracil(1498)-N(3))-methyltransferase [Candidatus Pacebacteria bacterium]|nr:16S rRNA (uracil(1498)-N(3))-methyltransferase [Candidatus Paceibacterota bacterium]MBP9867011.1 16S rRNA (uracil(1498)-N(3))-methyltransferase [Candidatus Paceibacterota bacterium]